MENIQRKYNVQLNYLKYFQLIAAILNYLKRKAQATAITNRNIFEEWDTFHFPENKVISLINNWFMLLAVHYRVMEHAGSLESTKEA